MEYNDHREVPPSSFDLCLIYQDLVQAFPLLCSNTTFVCFTFSVSR